MRRLRNTLTAILSVLVLLWSVFFASNGSAERTFVFDLEAVRRLAAAPPEQLAHELRVERVATGILPKLFVVSANTPFGAYPAVYAAYQVRYPGGESIIIDTAYDRASWQRVDGRLSVFDDASYERVRRGMQQAQHIVVTHEHADHLSGLAAQASDARTMQNARLTPEQVGNAVQAESGFTEVSLRAAESFAYDGMHRLAPGVVLVKAPGHSPGSQLIYVQLSDGKELVFVGDIAWNADSISRERTRPLVTSRFLKEDRNAVAAQLHMLHMLQLSHPQLAIVVAHDKAQLDTNVAAAFVKEGFVL